jgi:hypothetical protein
LVLLMKMSNKESSVEELVFDREYTVDDYAQANHNALYLPDSDAMLLYVAWCTNKELWMATMFGSFWTLDTTPMTNIEDIPLMIMAGMRTNRKSCPYGRAFLPSEGEWVFDLSMVVALSLLYGNNVIRNIQQVTTDGDRQIYNPLDLLSQNEFSTWYGVKHMLCTFHLVEQQFDNYVLNKEDREGIVYQVKNWIRSFKNYCESEDEYKLSYKLLIKFMNIPDVFEGMGPAYPYILDKYLLSTLIKNKDKLFFYKQMFLRNLNNCTSIPFEVDNPSIKQGEDRVRPTMSILIAAQVITDKSNHRMIVKEGKPAKSMSSTKLWSKSKTSYKITSHGEGLVETEYSLRNNYCSVRASDKSLWVMALSYIQELEKDVRVYGSPRFCRVRIVTLSTQGRLLCNCGYIHRARKPCCHCYHVKGVIECTYCEIIWWDSYHYHFEENIEYTRTAARIINSKKLGIPNAPNI